MRRIGFFITLVVMLAATSVAIAATSPPRGVLSQAEYNEFVALQRAEKKKPTSRNLAVIARRTCKSLTNVSRLTTTQHAECEASLVYSYAFYAFPYEVAQCAKSSTAAAQDKCLLTAIDPFELSVRAFIATNAASKRAADPRHFAPKCLDYLLFTRQQAQATSRLSAGLKRYARAVRGGNTAAITAAGTKLDDDMVSSRQAMSLNITVSVCAHQ